VAQNFLFGEFYLFILDDTTWDASTFSLKDAQFAIEQNPFNIASWDADISAFKNAGGKLRK
jgi:feruloyl esterase